MAITNIHLLLYMSTRTVNSSDWPLCESMVGSDITFPTYSYYLFPTYSWLENKLLLMKEDMT